MQCLILDNKEVKAAVDELTTVLGSKDAAYYVVSENNGHAIDQAPNGEPSKLFSDLLSHYNGNREQAIKAKVKVLTDEFKNWFGDWINNIEGSSKIVDENGEPLIVYHHSDNPQLNEFSIEFDNYFSTIKGGTKKAIFFTGNSNPKQGTVLDRNYKYPVFLNARHTIEKTGTKDELRSQQEDFVSTINRAANEVDAAVFHGIDDNQELNQDIYVINNPNNVKSVDNQGIFATQSNNIFKAESRQE